METTGFYFPDPFITPVALQRYSFIFYLVNLNYCWFILLHDVVFYFKTIQIHSSWFIFQSFIMFFLNFFPKQRYWCYVSFLSYVFMYLVTRKNKCIHELFIFPVHWYDHCIFVCILLLNRTNFVYLHSSH